MIAAHQTMLAPQGAPLPYDAEVEYLESTGTQYIDTGFVPTADTTFEMESIIVSSPYNFAPFAYCGASYNSMDTFGIARQNSSVGCNAYFGRVANAHVGDGITQLGDTINIKFRIGNTRVVLTNKTTEQTSTSRNDLGVSFTKGARTLYILSGNTGTADLAHPACMKLISFQMYDGSILVRDFQPVRVGSGSSAVGYLFDRVSGTLFGNAGTGAFTIGPDK